MLDGLYVGEGRCTTNVRSCFNNVMDPYFQIIMSQGQALDGSTAIAALSEAVDGSLLWMAMHTIEKPLAGAWTALDIAHAVSDLEDLGVFDYLGAVDSSYGSSGTVCTYV